MLGGLLEPIEAPRARERLPDWLLPHQADTVLRARAIIARFGGVLIADGVGLGKTYIALALAVLERAHGGDAVAVVPAALRTEWARASEAVRVNLTVFSHTELATRTPALTRRCSLVLVDEAHGFRNPHTRRYDSLARLVVGRRLALLTATPLNNAVTDLAALIHLFAARDRFRELGVADFEHALRSPDGSAAALALGAISVCRTRRLVEQRFPSLRTAFPRRVLLPAARYDLDATMGGALGQILEALSAAAAGDPTEERGSALLHLGLLRRLESSRAAFRRTLLRHRDFLDEWTRARQAGVHLTRREFQATVTRHDEEDTQLVLWSLLGRPQPGPARAAPTRWREAIEKCLERTDAAGAAPDAKLAALQALLAGELAGAKTIVFTEYRDTALYLLRHLRRHFRVLAVAGDGAWAGATRLTRREALDGFAPLARGAARDPLLDADVLIATDVASEGMNLQDACAVVNFDLPWNPVRVMQRVGRVDRLNSPHAGVRIVHFVPDGGLHSLTGVLRTLRAKLGDTQRTIGAEPDPLAALWWIDAGTPLPDALERESWRRVAPFEARERWRALVGTGEAGAHQTPIVAAGVVADGGPPAAGALLALEWPNGRRIPLPFTLGASGALSTDAASLGELAERALAARPIPTAPGEFVNALATVLPHARTQLLEYSAVRHGTAVVGAGRRAALERLARWAAAASRERAPTAAVERALRALTHELPVGLDRLLARLVSDHGAPEELAVRIAEIVERAAPLDSPTPIGAPRLVLVAAIALATECPARPLIKG